VDVPFKYMLTLKTAQEGPLGKIFSEKRLNPTVIMALHLMNEKQNATSAWKPWLDVLPSTFETPIYWSEADLEEMKGSTLLSVVQKRQDTIVTDHKALFESLNKDYPGTFDMAKYTVGEFKWALSTVWSRAFVFNVEKQLVPVIVPFADMFSHANVESEFSLEEEAGAFRIKAGQDYKAGEPVYISLGQKPNSQLLLNYGFVLDQNPYDTVMINMFLNEDDPFYDIKSKMLKARGQPAETLYYLGGSDLPADFLRALRVQLMKPSELDSYAKVFDNKRVSLENELDVYRQVVAACDTLLKQYPTSAVNDSKAIASEEFKAFAERKQTAMVLRFGEKRVLHRTVELISQAWSQFLISGFADEKAKK